MPIHFTEKRDIETALQMGSGYVLDFSNRTFAEFIAASIGLDIYAGPYSTNGGSKANHLRAFFDKAPDYQIGRLLTDLIVHARQTADDRGAWGTPVTEADIKRFDRCQAIAARLKMAQPVENLAALRPNAEDKDFSALAKAIREGIERHERWSRFVGHRFGFCKWIVPRCSLSSSVLRGGVNAGRAVGRPE